MKNLKLKSSVKMYGVSFLAIALLLGMLLSTAPKQVSLDYIDQTSIFIKKVDLNGDKEEDVVAINKEKNKLYYFLNLGGDKYEECYLTNLETKTPKASLTITSEGETSLELSFLVPLQPAELELKLEDKDEDGDVDIFVSDLRGSRWFINDGKGKFTKKDEKFYTHLEITYTK